MAHVYDSQRISGNAVFLSNSVTSGNTVSPSSGSIAYSGYTPTMSQPHTVAVGSGAVLFSGCQADISQSSGVRPDAGNIVFSGYAPAISNPRALSIGVGSVALAGYASKISQQAIVLTLTQADLDAIATAVWAKLIDSYTAEQLFSLQSAILLGKVSGAGTGTETFRNVDDTKDMVVATVDANGNRTAITLNP